MRLTHIAPRHPGPDPPPTLPPSSRSAVLHHRESTRSHAAECNTVAFSTREIQIPLQQLLSVCFHINTRCLDHTRSPSYQVLFANVQAIWGTTCCHSSRRWLSCWRRPASSSILRSGGEAHPCCSHSCMRVIECQWQAESLARKCAGTSVESQPATRAAMSHWMSFGCFHILCVRLWQ